MFPTATSHGRGVDQLDPGDVSFSSVHRLARRSFLSAILPNPVQATRERLAIRRSFRLRANAFLFLDQCGTREVLQGSRTQAFREDGRAEYHRLREAGSETTSKMFRVDRSSTLIFSGALGLRLAGVTSTVATLDSSFFAFSLNGGKQREGS
jgi:hypothetical protein